MRPTLFAGLPFITWVTYMPWSTGRSKASTSNGSNEAALMPSQGGRITLLSFNLGSRVVKVFVGTAKPMLPRPRFRGLKSLRETCIAVLIPTTWPWRFSNGPPELPGLINASVCSTPEMGRERSLLRVRSVPLITPTVMDPPKPKGLPMAMASWPGRVSLESPRVNGLMSLTASELTLSIARSLAGFVPKISASTLVPSSKDIRMRSAP